MALIDPLIEPVINGPTTPALTQSSDSSSPPPPLPPTRHHSTSISSVHFLNSLPHRDSTSSLRDTIISPVRQHHLVNGIAKAQPSSPLRPPPEPSTPPDDAKSFQDFKQSPKRYPSHAGTDQFTRKASQDRRIRSDGNPRARAERSGSLLSRRASAITGGYETSSSDTEDEEDDEDVHPKTAIPIPLSARSRASMPSPQSLSFAPDDLRPHIFRHRSHEGRKRASSLMLPMTEEGHNKQPSLLSNGPIPSPLPLSARPRAETRRNSKDPQHSAEAKHKAAPKPTDVASTKLAPEPANGDDGNKPPSISASSVDRKGKGKAKNVNHLGTSLGLDGHNGAVSLTTDQINQLLNDSDVSSALRIIQSHQGPRILALPPAVSLSSSPAGPSRPTSPQHHEVFIPQAPPALLQDEQRTTRDREVSISSTIDEQRIRLDSISSVGNGVRTSPHRVSVDGNTDPRLQRARAGSRIEAEGGHIPFTHHAPIVPVDELTDDVSEATTISRPLERPRGNGAGSSEEHVKKLRKQALGGKNRLSQLFHIKRKHSEDSLSTKSDKGRSSIEHHKKEEERLLREKEREREREKAERDSERKRIEQERREAELAQERRFKALTQVTAHPDSERNAYRASCHLRAYYNHVYDGIENLPPMNPLAILRWKHRTEEQLQARQRWEKIHGTSLGEFGATRSSPQSLCSKVLASTSSHGKEPGANWRYTVDDITSYKDANGVVNYFVPPRPTFDHAHANSSSPRSVRSPSPLVPEEERSVMGSTGRTSSLRAKVPSTSTPSLAGAPPSTLSNEPLSRSTSIEARRHKEHKLTHRTHHSLSTMGQHTFSHALKAPFEKLGSVARSKRYESTPYGQTEEDESSRMWHHPSHQPSRTSMARREWQPAIDDDRNGEFHLRKLFLKGQRIESRRLGLNAIPNDDTKLLDKEAELKALENALAKEIAFRERQAEAERRTAEEDAARERMRHLEEEIYAERSRQLLRAKERLERININLEVSIQNVRHYLAQIDQLSAVSKITAEVDVDFPNLSPLRTFHAKRLELKAARGEADILSPVKRSSVYESGSESGSRRPSRRNSLVLPKRKLSIGTLPPLLSLGIQPWPRRTSLDPSGKHRVNPIRRAELTIKHAKTQHSALTSRRDEALSSLQRMIALIDSLIKQKDAVRSWTKSALDTSRSLRSTRDTLQAELDGNTSARLARVYDAMFDRSARMVIWPMINLLFSTVGWSRWFVSRRSEAARRNFRRHSGGRVGVCCWLVFLIVGVAAGLAWLGGQSEL